MPEALQTYVTDRIWIPGACELALTEDRAQILPRLSRLAIPTLLLQGVQSPPVIAEITAALARVLPNARVEGVRGAAHMAPLTHPGPTAQAIARFLGIA